MAFSGDRASDNGDHAVLDAPCIGGGKVYVGHGDDVVLLAFTEGVGWWKNSVGLHPSAARQLAAVLIQQAEQAEQIARTEQVDG